MALESVRVPEVGESVTDGTIAAWFAEPGTTISAGDPLFELATEKVDSEIPSPVSGTVVEILIPQGGSVSVGDAVITIETGSPSSTPSPASPSTPTSTPEADDAGQKEVPARKSRRSRRQAASSESAGSLPLPPMPPGRSHASAAPILPFAEPGEGDTFVPFTRVRSVTSRIVATSSTVIPHVLSMVEVDHTAVLNARDVIKARGVKPPTALAFTAVAVARALGEFPILNSSVGDGGLVLHGDVNLSFAVDAPDGLVAPVIKKADRLTVTGMSEAIVDVAARARAKELGPDDMAGGTFSISNNGSVGSVLTAAIITPPQVAVLSTDKVVDRAVVLERDGVKSIGIRPMGNLSLSWDHRAMDGADAARFLTRVKEIIETTDWSSVV